MTDHQPTTQAFRQFQYLSLPLSVSNDFKNQTLKAALSRVYDHKKGEGR